MPTKTTKIDTVLKLVERKQGATTEQLQKATGWQPHSLRAALTGLRKKGHAVAREKTQAGATRYRVSAEG